MKNKPLPSPQPVPPATRAQVDAFLKGLQRFRAKGIDKDAPLDEAEVKKYDEAGVKAFLDNMTVGSQQAIARRIMMDIMKSPTKDFPDKSKRKPTKKKKTSPKVKSKRAPKKSKAPKRSAVKKKKASRRR
jgi:hypothetical protein